MNQALDVLLSKGHASKNILFVLKKENLHLLSQVLNASDNNIARFRNTEKQIVR